MVELLSRLRPSDLAEVLMILGAGAVVGLIALAALVIKAVQRYREHEIAASLVSEMLARGVAPQDIVSILKAMGIEPPPEGKRRARFGRWAPSSAQQPTA